jgi:protein-disulfide isomerase
MNASFRIAGVIALAALAAACSPTPEAVGKVLKDNPELLRQAVAAQLAGDPEALFAAMEQHPEAFMAALNKAAAEQKRLAQQRQLDDAFANPKTPAIAADRVIFGNPAAPITIVEYSDFECPYCSRANPTVQQVMSHYGDKVRVVYKHMPLSFHKMALPAARYYEAVGLQDPAKARAFHDALFANQQAFAKGGEDYLKQTAAGLGVDMARLAADVTSEQVAARIQADSAEAQSFGIRGTPGFIINGVPLSGAQPFAAFQAIIERHLAEG